MATAFIVPRRVPLLALLCLAIMVLLGAGDESARFNDLGHRMMCACGCNQILLECNHVGCAYSDRMRAELVAAVDRGDSDDLTLQGFVQKYGPTVLAAPTKSGFNRVVAGNRHGLVHRPRLAIAAIIEARGCAGSGLRR